MFEGRIGKLALRENLDIRPKEECVLGSSTSPYGDNNGDKSGLLVSSTMRGKCPGIRFRYWFACWLAYLFTFVTWKLDLKDSEQN